MTGRRIAALVAGALLASAQTKGHADVTVYITASQPVMPVYLATSAAGAMFRSIGVEVAWAARKPKQEAGESGIQVRLAGDTPKSAPAGALAVSHPYAGGKEITVYYDRVQRRAQETFTPERMLLAHVLVHEITHVLEGMDRHSDSGVMKAHWSAADYAAMARGPLGFDADDVYWIRYSVTKLAAISRPKAAAN